MTLALTGNSTEHSTRILNIFYVLNDAPILVQITAVLEIILVRAKAAINFEITFKLWPRKIQESESKLQQG